MPRSERRSSAGQQSRNLAARMGRWSAAHRKAAILGWLAFVVLAFGVGTAVGTKTIDPNTAGPGESGRADKVLDAGFEQPAGESVLIQSRTLRAGDPAFVAAVEDVVARLGRVHAVQHLRSPLRRGATDQIAPDRHATLVRFDVRGDRDLASAKINAVVDQVALAQKAHPHVFIGEYGDASSQAGVDAAFAGDLATAGLFSLPITLLILVVAFGALVAAGIPLLLALTAVFATIGLLAVPSHVLPQAQQVPAIVLLIGLAVGVDYSMFYLKRERAERAAGAGPQAALETAAATSGRSVLISGLTVMVAMAGMFLTGDAGFASFGLATMMVVACAMLGSLTVLPAVLSKLGDKVDRLRVPLAGRPRRSDDTSRLWGTVVRAVLRRPVVCAALSGGLLVAIALPALQLHLATPGPETFPASLPVVKAYDRMQKAFPGRAVPADVVVKAPDVNAPEVRTAIAELERRAIASGRMHQPIAVAVNRDATVADLTVPVDGKGSDARSDAALAVLRDRIVPETVGAVPGVQTGVTGLTARWHDGAAQIKAKLPVVVAFVSLLAFGLMLFAFRSLVLAVKAIVLNLLSVAAACGVLVLVFQHGAGKGLLGFSASGGVDPVVPMLLFVILFGLSMDYHVFIISRVRETFAGGASTEDAIAEGITSTAGVVTSAAVVMVSVFAIFGALSMLFFKQFGVGLASAILIDATVVRAVLLPATMSLLGDWNWYLPRWLQWLPGSGTPKPAAAPAAVAAPVSA